MTPTHLAPRYDRVAIVLHWVLGVALLAQITFGYLLDDVAPKGTPVRANVINLHKSVGMVLGLLLVLRLIWRLSHPAPAWPPALSAAQQRAALWGHRALYACMLLLPLAGYIASNFSKHGVRFFGLKLDPWGADDPALYAFFNGAHGLLGFALSVLVAGHVLAALYHALVRKDGVWERMRPSA